MKKTLLTFIAVAAAFNLVFARDYLPVITPDRSWDVQYIRLVDTGYSEPNYVLDTVRTHTSVAGDTIINGKNYWRLTEVGPDKCTHYLNEENGVLTAYNVYANGATEIRKLLDFNLQKGDSLWSYDQGEKVEPLDVVLDEFEQEIAGANRKVLVIGKEKQIYAIWIEGIGSNFPQWFEMPDVIPTMFVPYYRWTNWYDNGDCFFTVDDFPSTPTSIPTAWSDAEKPTGEVEYFNLQGMKVVNPQPGQIYIRRQGNCTEKLMIR